MSTRLVHNLRALADLSAAMASSTSFDELTRVSLHTLLGTLAVSRGAIARYSGSHRRLKIVAVRGEEGMIGAKLSVTPDEAELLAGSSAPITTESEALSDFISRNGELLSRLRTRLIVPMSVRGDLMGIVALSSKVSNEEFDPDDIEMIGAIAAHIGIAHYNHRLHVTLKRKAAENRRLYRDVRRMYQDVVKAFGAAIDLKDSYTKGHSDRVARYSEAIAREMGMTGEELEKLCVAAYLHDIGKIVVDRSIMNNPKPLTEREVQELNRHVVTGYEILATIDRPWDEIAFITKCHHEKVDGSGYPNGLRDAEIPLGSKIVTLADSFDAMMSDRPYRSRLPLEEALSDLRRNSGRQFAREVVSAFCRLLLKEISGKTRQRVFLSSIGSRFDRARVCEALNAMISDCEAVATTHSLH